MSASPSTERIPSGTLAEGLAIGGVAFALRFLHLISLRGLPTFEGNIMDEAYHNAWARQIASGDWIGHEVFFRAPLYPYFLGMIYKLCGTGGTAPRLVQDLVGAVSVVLLHRIGLRVAGRAATGLGAILMALCWPLIYFDNELLITVLEVFLSLATILILMKADESGRSPALMFLGGLVLGLAAIARPNMLVFAPFACAWVAWPFKRARFSPVPIACILAGLTVPILPVTARNWVVGHDLVLISSQGGVNFFIGNNPDSDGTTAVVPGTRPTWQGGYEDTITMARKDAGRDLPPSGVSRYWFAKGLAFWRDEPGRAAGLLLRKTMIFLGGIEISNNKDLTFFRGLSPVLSLPLPGTWLLSPLGILGWALAWSGRKEVRRGMSLVLLFAISYMGSIVFFFVTSRYRAPVLPVLALGCGLLARELVERVRAHQLASATRIVLAAAGLLLILNVNLFGYADDPGQGHLSLAVAYQIAGHTDEAIKELDASIAAGGPYLYEALHIKGEALLAIGKPSEACDHLVRSLEVRPGNLEALTSLMQAAVRANRYAEARAFALNQIRDGGPTDAAIHFIIGSADQMQGRLAGAESEYRLALALDPTHLGARVNLALLLRDSGRLDESLRELQEAERTNPDEPVVQVNLAKHYLFLGDRQEALRRVARARALGGRIDPQFQQALGTP